jgi:mono/diheme cytochrome c family protein
MIWLRDPHKQFPRPQTTIDRCRSEARMRLRAIALLVALTALPLALPAEQAAPTSPLTETQKSGQRLYNRECAVCHAPPLINSKAYAPILYKDLIEGQEDATRRIIINGLPNLMPGFEYGLKPSEIDAIVEYMKTVPKPSPSDQKGQAGENEKRTD